MNDCGLIMSITAIACGIIKCCSEDDISILSVAFSQLGDTLATYLTQKELCENKQTDAVGIPRQITDSNANSNNNSNNGSVNNSNNNSGTNSYNGSSSNWNNSSSSNSNNGSGSSWSNDSGSNWNNGSGSNLCNNSGSNSPTAFHADSSLEEESCDRND